MSPLSTMVHKVKYSEDIVQSFIFVSRSLILKFYYHIYMKTVSNLVQTSVYLKAQKVVKILVLLLFQIDWQRIYFLPETEKFENTFNLHANDLKKRKKKKHLQSSSNSENISDKDSFVSGFC